MIDIDRYEERAVLIATDIFTLQVKSWNAAIRNQMDGFGDYLSLPPVDPAFQRLTEKAMTLAYLAGRAKVKAVIDRTKAKVRGLEFDDKNPYDLTTFDEAMQVLRGKGVISPVEFKAASGKIKACTFSIQRIERLNAIIAIKESLAAAVNNGLVFRDWVDTLPAIWDAHGVTPLKRHHLETIYRTNMGSSYEIANDEATKDDPWVWGYEYVGVPDGRESEICRPFFGMKRKKGDPVWNVARPLNHYKCRCTVLPLTQYDVKELGVKETGTPETGGIPDDFRQTPRTMDEYQRFLGKLVKKKEERIRELGDLPEKVKSKKGEIIPIDVLIKEKSYDILRKTKNAYERAVLIGHNDQVVLEKNGDRNTVDFSKNPNILDKTKILLHNHPSGSCFSTADICTTLVHGIKEIRAITGGGPFGKGSHVFLNQSPQSMADAMCADLLNIDKKVFLVFTKNVIAGKASIDWANERHAFVVIRRFVAKYKKYVKYMWEDRE